MSLHTVLEQKADHERIVFAVEKLREKCAAITADQLHDVQGRFMRMLYMQNLTPQHWYRTALGIGEDVLAEDFEDLAGTVNQILFVSSRFHFAAAPQPEILRYYEVGEAIPDSIEGAQLSLGDHSMHDIPGYLENRLGSTLIDLMRSESVGIEMFIGSREDMVAYFRSREPSSSLRGELDSPTSTEFYLFEDNSGSATVAIRGFSNRSRFYHVLWQLRYAGIELKRVRTRGTFDAALRPQLEALRRELANLPVQPTIAIMGQRWWPMEILGTLAGITGREGEAYETLQPANFRIGPFTFDYLIADVAGAPATRNKVGVVAFRMPNGSLAGEAIHALIDNGTTHVLLAGAGGSLDARADVGSYQICREATYDNDVHVLPCSSIFTPELGDDFPLVEIGPNITVDSPLEETKRWLERSSAVGATAVDVEAAHLINVLARAIACNPDIRVTPGLFISDVVGGKESLSEKISGENAYVHLRALLKAYFSQSGIASVYDSGGNLHPFAVGETKANPALVRVAQPAPDDSREAILGVRLDVEDFRILSAPKRKVCYPDLQSMGGHKQILYLIPPAAGMESEMCSFLDSGAPDKLFLTFPADTSPNAIELANRRGYETIIIIEPDEASYAHADYIISTDSGWGTYETIIATASCAVAVFGNPEGYGELLIAMENKDRAIFVSEIWRRSSSLVELDDFQTFESYDLAEKLDKTLRLRKLEAWVAKVRPEIEIVPLSGVRAYAEGRKIVGVSGSSRIAQFDHEATETAFRQLLTHLIPEETMFGTGGTDYGVEQILHRLIREEFPAFQLIGFITNEGKGDDLGTPAVTVAGNDWFGKSVPFLNAIDFFVTVAGGGVIHQELLMAHKAEMPIFPLAGSGMKTDEFLQSHSDVPRYFTGNDIAEAIRRHFGGSW
jgi:hypothetical protein